MTIDFDLARLAGQELSSVLIATNSIRLQFVRYPLSRTGDFEDSTVVEIEHGYEASSPTAPAVLLRDGIEKFRLGTCSILGHIEHIVKRAERSSNGDLHLLFDDEFSLRILAGDDGFEGFQVHGQRTPLGRGIAAKSDLGNR